MSFSFVNSGLSSVTVDTLTDLYQAPSGYAVAITAITVCNDTAGVVHVEIQRTASDNTLQEKLTSSYAEIPSGVTVSFEVKHNLFNEQKIRVKADNANVHFGFSGVRKAL